MRKANLEIQTYQLHREEQVTGGIGRARAGESEVKSVLLGKLPTLEVKGGEIGVENTAVCSLFSV